MTFFHNFTIFTWLNFDFLLIILQPPYWSILIKFTSWLSINCDFFSWFYDNILAKFWLFSRDFTTLFSYIFLFFFFMVTLILSHITEWWWFKEHFFSWILDFSDLFLNPLSASWKEHCHICEEWAEQVPWVSETRFCKIFNQPERERGGGFWWCRA